MNGAVTLTGRSISDRLGDAMVVPQGPRFEERTSVQYMEQVERQHEEKAAVAEFAKNWLDGTDGES